MSKFLINGNKPIRGEVDVHGAKNSVLPILAATLLCGGESVIVNCPDLTDVDASVRILRHLGCTVRREGGSITVDSSTLTGCEIPDQLMREMRSSVIFLGAILARTGCAQMTYPGGCELGSRPIDLHLAALRSLGADISETDGHIRCTAANLRGCELNLKFPSVGATENIMLAACCAKGETIISNAACEPEIEDLQNFLVSQGADITGAGTPIIRIRGVSKLHGSEHKVIPDRIVAATFLCACASSGGEVLLRNVIPGHFSTVSEILAEAGCTVRIMKDSVYIKRDKRLRAVRPVMTAPYPGFPTDAQAPLMAALLRAEGTSVIVENIFENRYRHVGELLRMGADIRIEGRTAIITGVERTYGASVRATDLRGGAAMVVAALGADGESEISEVLHIDRGYDGLTESLQALGTDIKRAVPAIA
ncbi:MAG: UDP-N-acetylglucosamine 1-carboxyvinyltransferase [Oscillospiraceae bacterium]|jgi:UDP-N-acetylglucosamine 1-carboxyvinyltransferase